MHGHIAFTALLALQTISTSFAECPNACSGHGSCGLFDSCVCYPNWIGGDCGERVCPFGRAFSDTPKGDLDGSKTIEQTKVLVGSDVYPLGTAEEFPIIVDSLSNTFTQTAHDYYECSNTGTCSRLTGQCKCFKGYEGHACQRSVCAENVMGVCSGHGKCWSVGQMSEKNDGEHYELWDKDKSYGCHCDPGYYGVDCLSRHCPVGVDPQYLRTKQEVVPTTVVAFAIYDQACDKSLSLETYPYLRRLAEEEGAERAAEESVGKRRTLLSEELRADYVKRGLVSAEEAESDTAAEAAVREEYLSQDEASRATMRKLQSSPTPAPTIARLHTDATLTGTFALKFYDVFGEDYTTKPIKLEDYTRDSSNSGVNSCPDIKNALEALPNTVIDFDTVHCQEQTMGVGYAAECGVTYSLTYTGNPGYLKDLEVDYYLDGSHRATIFNHFGEPGVNVTAEIFTENNVGSVDYWATKCEGVEVTTSWLDDSLLDVNKWGYVSGIDTGKEYASLVSCLGDSDGIESNNVEVYNWDYGSWSSPTHGADYASNAKGRTSAMDYAGSGPYSSVMSGNPHIVRLVPKTLDDYHDPTQLALVWVDQNRRPTTIGDTGNPGWVVWMATPPDKENTVYIPYATDGTAEVVFYDTDGDQELHATSLLEPRVTARFTRGSNTLYTSYDTACETASGLIQPCLDKGDMIFLFDANWGRTFNGTTVKNGGNGQYNSTQFGGSDYYTAKEASNGDGAFYGNRNYNTNTGIPYTIKKVYKHHVTAITLRNKNAGLEDRYRIELDKGVNWGNELTLKGNDPDGDGQDNSGYVQIIKFSPATTGNYQFASECSGRGSCDLEQGSCECAEGYLGLACELFDTLAM